MSCKKLPYAVEPLEPSVSEKIKRLCPAQTEGMVLVGPQKFILPFNLGLAAERLYNFQARPDDIWIVTYPRSGTTLTQEMTWLILNDDYDKAARVPLSQRFPFFEWPTIFSDKILAETKGQIGDDPEKLTKFLEGMKPQWEELETCTVRRFIKTHLPLCCLSPTLLTSGAKVIYVARNPKNVATSRFKQCCSPKLDDFKGTFRDFWDLFENNLVRYSPYWEHLEQGYQRRNDPNFLFLFYEDIIKDYGKAIVKVSEFLNKPMTDSQISKLVDYLQIDTYRENHMDELKFMELLIGAAPNQFIGKGQSGNWCEYFPEDLNERANQWIHEQYKKTTLRFPINLD